MHEQGPCPLHSLLNPCHHHCNTLILNAIAALPVRDGHEVVSGISCFRWWSLLQYREHVWEGCHGKSKTLLSAALECGFMTFTNSSPKELPVEDNSDLPVCLAHPGESHWFKIPRLESQEIFKPEKLWQVIVICITLVEYTSSTASEKMTPWKIISLWIWFMISDFLNAYCNEQVIEARICLFWKFSAYLSLVCHYKTRLLPSKSAIRCICESPIWHLESLFIILHLSDSVHSDSQSKSLVRKNLKLIVDFDLSRSTGRFESHQFVWMRKQWVRMCLLVLLSSPHVIGPYGTGETNSYRTLWNDYLFLVLIVWEWYFWPGTI